MLVVPRNSTVNAITLRSRDSNAEATIVPEHGAIVASLRLPTQQGLRECLYRSERFWSFPRDDLAGGMPFVFPAFGRLEAQGELGVYHYRGDRYRLPIHGFAWQLPWAIAAQSDTELSLLLTDTPDTRLQYPFAFELRLEYRLQADGLQCVQHYRNRGATPLPFSAGFHPYFATPGDVASKQQVQLDFHAQQQFDYNERFTQVIAKQKPVTMPTSILDPALQDTLSQLGQDKQVLLTFPTGERLCLQAEGVEDPAMFAYLQLYTKSEHPFFCAEPITSPPNSLNSGQGLRWLAPGQTERAVFRLCMHKIHDT